MHTSDTYTGADESQLQDMQDLNLLVSCPNYGGLLRIRKGLPVYIDNESTTGICLHNGRLFRCVQNSEQRFKSPPVVAFVGSA